MPAPWRDPSREARYGFWMGVTWTVPAVLVAFFSLLIAAGLALIALLGYLAYLVARGRR